MWAYAGLDVASRWELTGSTWIRRKVGQNSQQPAISYEPVRDRLLQLPERAMVTEMTVDRVACRLQGGHQARQASHRY
jgi:hypothetical protein